MDTDRHRSTRDRPAKPPLSEDAILDAALAVLKSEGLAAVTMRRVGTALDTGAASLYVYVSGREGLLQAMLDRVLSGVRLQTPDPSRWREQLHALLLRMHQALIDHPGIAATTLADPPPTQVLLRLNENMLGILLAGGLDPQEAVWACDLFAMLVTAAAIEEDERKARGADPTQHADELHHTFAGLPVGQFPLITAHAAEMVAGDRLQRFRFGVDVIIDGVVARSGRSATR